MQPIFKIGNDLFSLRPLFYRKLVWLLRVLIWQQALFVVGVSKRVLDIVVSFTLIVFLLPIMAIIWCVFSNGARIVRTTYLGRWVQPFDMYSFSRRRRLYFEPLYQLPVLFNILFGDMSFVGPRCVSPDEVDLSKRGVWKRFDVRPGLVCLWWIRERANIHYGTEIDSDGDYVDTYSALQDLGVVARALPAALYGKAKPTSDRLHILGLPIHNVTMNETLTWISNQLQATEPAQLCFLNADCANIAWHHDDYFKVINQADLSLADGIGLKVAGRLLGRDIRQNINGTDLFPELCKTFEETEHRIFLLGGRPGVAQDVKAWIHTHYPNVKISGIHDGYFSPEQESEVIQKIAESNSSLLLVALGAPRQDLWIHENLQNLGVPLAIGVGGLFDFYSGRIPRAPQWLRELCLEWVYRLVQEPKRMWKRYLLGNFIFICRVIIEKCGWLPKRRHPILIEDS